MDGFTTITQKGQVAIPKSIRDRFNLKPSDRIRFTVQDQKIIAEPALRISDMLGIVPAKEILSKREYKEIIRKRVIKKYAGRT